MPHSSGGGSHSSGGSHHSGGGSHHSGGSSSSSSIRKTYFHGSSRYVYYNHGAPHYFYSDQKPGSTKSSVASMIFEIVLFCPFILAGIFVFISSVSMTQKLTSATDTNVIISDKLGIIDNTDELTATLENFADETGIIPMVATVSNEEWRSHYIDLETYAFDRYLNMCDDESHWLIVYSQPQSADTDFVDWHWEGMQGDDTDSILTDSVLDKFNSTMQKELTKTNGSVGTDINTAFESVPLEMGQIVINWSLLLFGIIWSGVIAFMIFLTVGADIKTKQFAKAEEIPLDAQEQTCQYCGGKYIVGTLTNCPHCGATILYYANDRNTVLNGESINNDSL